MKSTQRSESTNNIFHQIPAKTIELIIVVQHYDNEANEMRLEELQDDNKLRAGARFAKALYSIHYFYNF